MTQPINPLIYATIKNDVDRNKYNKLNLSFAYSDLDHKIDATTIKRACCQYKGKSGNGYLFKDPNGVMPITVTIPLTDDLKNNYSKNSIERKYNIHNKTVNVPVSECDKYPSYSYDGEGGATDCDIFYKIYCDNALQDYKRYVGADTDISKYSIQEFSRFKPECACYAEPSPIMKEMHQGDEALLLRHPECWPNGSCTTAEYQPTNKRAACSLHVTKCVQQILLETGGKVGGSAAIGGNTLVNDCGQNPPLPTPPLSANAITSIANAIGPLPAVPIIPPSLKPPVVVKPVVQPIVQPVSKSPVVSDSDSDSDTDSDTDAPVKKPIKKIIRKPKIIKTNNDMLYGMIGIILMIVIFVIIYAVKQRS